MKKLLLILLLCMGMFSSHAQQFFYKRDALHSFASVITSVVPFNSKYFSTGVCFDSINYIGNGQAYFIGGIKFAVFDESGNKLRDTVYQKPYRGIAAWSNNLHLMQDKTFLLATEIGDTNNVLKTLLVKIDTTGEVFWEKEIDKPFCTANNDYWIKVVDFRVVEGGNFLMLSRISCKPSPNAATQVDLLLSKFDSALNILWHKQYGSNSLDEGGWKIYPEVNGYLIAAGRHNLRHVSKNFSFRALLMKIDTNGVEQWTWLSDPSKKTFEAKDVIRTKDGGYVYCGQGDGNEYLSANGQQGYMEFKGWVEKLDSNRNVVWSMTTNNVYSNWESNEQRVLKELKNGDIVVAGSLWDQYSSADTELHHFGAITRIDPLGNIIWQRKYRMPNDTLTYLIYDMKLTDDGGFVFCGEATDKYYPYNAPSQRGWIVKVDSNGCLGPGDPQCWPVSVPTQSIKTSVVVYPNPVKDYWYIRNTEENQLSITITDLAGRVLSSFQSSNATVRWDMSNYAPGIYLYRVADGKGAVLQGKFVKQ
ncbi:MAG TPA: T9SS type A sorting domain-containing protein [Flavipsychrobacter sp.]|nr:T9SS type A sorting domain-containing protein [Flavipsychrobacter sp.]